MVRGVPLGNSSVLAQKSFPTVGQPDGAMHFRVALLIVCGAGAEA